MSAGPNLLAWAKEIIDAEATFPTKTVAEQRLSLLAQSILADEEERKRRLAEDVLRLNPGIKVHTGDIERIVFDGCWIDNAPPDIENIIELIVDAEKHGYDQQVADLIEKARDLGYIVTKTDGGYVWRAEPPSE